MDNLRQIIETPPWNAGLGLQLEDFRDGGLRVVLPYKDENSNPGRGLHGGVGASVVNIAAQALTRSVLGENSGPWHTASIEIDYLAAAIGESVIGEARLLRKGKELCFVGVDLATPAGKPIIHGAAIVRGRFGADAAPAPLVQREVEGNDPGLFVHMAKHVPFIRRVGLQMEHMGAGQVRLRLPFKPENTDTTGAVAEGAILSLLDTAGANAAWAGFKPGPYRSSTVELHAQLFGQTGPDDLLAYGRLIHRERECFWSEIDIATAGEKKLVARGTILYRVVIPEAIPWA